MSQSLLERATNRVPSRVRPAWKLVVRTALDTVDDRVHGLAAEAAFFALLSLPPLLLAIIGSIGFVVEQLDPAATEDVRRVVFGVPRTFLSPDTFDFYEGIATGILEEGRGDIVSFGFVVALWSGSRAVNVYLEAIALAYDLERPRTPWKRRVLAFLLTLAAVVILIVVIPSLVMGPRLIDLVAPSGTQMADWAVTTIFYGGVGLLTVGLLATFYHVGVPWHTPWRRDLPGALVAMVLWLLGALALRAYVQFSFDDESLYGSLATPLVVMLWLYVTAFAVLLGAELNAEIEKMWPHDGTPPDVAGEEWAPRPFLRHRGE